MNISGKAQTASPKSFLKIDEWIDSASSWEIGKIWPILCTLDSRRKLSRENKFKLPIDLISARIKNYTNLENVLSGLVRTEVIELLNSRKNRNSSDKNRHMDENTNITIHDELFNYIVQKVGPIARGNVLKWRGLVLNKEKQVLSYETCSKGISLGNNIPKFIQLMLESKDKGAITYSDIAKKLEMNCSLSNATEVAVRVQEYKRQVVEYLIKLGMPNDEISAMIIPKTSIGYLLGTEN